MINTIRIYSVSLPFDSFCTKIRFINFNDARKWRKRFTMFLFIPVILAIFVASISRENNLKSCLNLVSEMRERFLYLLVIVMTVVKAYKIRLN